MDNQIVCKGKVFFSFYGKIVSNKHRKINSFRSYNFAISNGKIFPSRYFTE